MNATNTSTSTMTTSTKDDFIGFHHACFPHLLTSIIDAADYSTLLALRQTSSSVGAEVDRRLFRHALVQRPSWPPSASPLYVGGGALSTTSPSGPSDPSTSASSPSAGPSGATRPPASKQDSKRSLPIPHGDSPGEKARLTRLLHNIAIVDDVSGGILVGWRKDLAPRIVRRKGLAEATMLSPCLVDAVDVPFSTNANWSVTAAMQRIPEGVERYAAHIRCLSPPEASAEGTGRQTSGAAGAQRPAAPTPAPERRQAALARGPAHVKFGCPLPASTNEVSLIFDTCTGQDDFSPMHFYAAAEEKTTLLSPLVEQVAADLLLHPTRKFTFVGLDEMPAHIYDREMGEEEDVAEHLVERLREQLECNTTVEEAGRILDERVQVLTKEAYRDVVGEERFELEAGWNGVAGAPRVV